MSAVLISQNFPHMEISNKACALFVPIWLHMTRDNTIKKKKILGKITNMADSRTLNKYWGEVVTKGLLKQVDSKTWMMNPLYAHYEGCNYNNLLKQWEAA